MKAIYGGGVHYVSEEEQLFASRFVKLCGQNLLVSEAYCRCLISGVQAEEGLSELVFGNNLEGEAHQQLKQKVARIKESC